jgi:hypothetical protein
MDTESVSKSKLKKPSTDDAVAHLQTANKNIDKAVETLGGLESIESSVAEHGRKLELHFHPENKYNKACVADKDFKPGILIKVKKSSFRTRPSCSDDPSCNEPKFDYTVEGVSVINFSFNRK